MLNQVIKECFKETIKHVRRVILCIASICEAFLLEYQAIKKCNQAIKVNFIHQIFDPGRGWFYWLNGPMG